MLSVSQNQPDQPHTPVPQNSGSDEENELHHQPQNDGEEELLLNTIDNNNSESDNSPQAGDVDSWSTGHFPSYLV